MSSSWNKDFIIIIIIKYVIIHKSILYILEFIPYASNVLMKHRQSMIKKFRSWISFNVPSNDKEYV